MYVTPPEMHGIRRDITDRDRLAQVVWAFCVSATYLFDGKHPYDKDGNIKKLLSEKKAGW